MDNMVLVEHLKMGTGSVVPSALVLMDWSTLVIANPIHTWTTTRASACLGIIPTQLPACNAQLTITAPLDPLPLLLVQPASLHLLDHLPAQTVKWH